MVKLWRPRKGQKYKLEDMEQLFDAVEELQRLSVGPGLELKWTAAGPVISLAEKQAAV